jgi:tetrapyrrole methylase family protein/MazG family protein
MNSEGNKTGASLERLVEIMALLRSENGCPWDREQTHQTLRACFVEETYEVLEAIDAGRMDKLREELGDVLLQVVFHAQLAAERGDFEMADVVNGISDKLVRRHPHVFASTQVDGVAGVLENWEKIKKTEMSGERESALDGVPIDLPALMKAAKIQSKAAKSVSIGITSMTLWIRFMKNFKNLKRFLRMGSFRNRILRNGTGLRMSLAIFYLPWSM